MTTKSPFPHPISRGRTLKSRYRRTKPTPAVALTARDVAFLTDCAYLRIIPGNATPILLASHCPTFVPPRSYWKEREAQLFHGQWLSRFYPPTTPYVVGARFPIYIMEPGYVSYAIDAGDPVTVLAGPERKTYLTQSAAMREKLLLLMTAGGIDAAMAASMLENNGVLAEKYCGGRTSTVPHFLLGATFLAVAWYGLRKAGYTIEHRVSDGFIDWQFRAVAGDSARIQPDFFFTIDHPLGRSGYVLEAETGEQGAKAIAEKVRIYNALWFAGGTTLMRDLAGCPDLASYRVVFYCATAQHAQTVARVIAKEVAGVASRFLIVTADTIHLDYAHSDFKTNPIVADDRTTLYDYVGRLVLNPVFMQVQGRSADGAPIIGYVPLVDRMRIEDPTADVAIERRARDPRSASLNI